MRRNEILTGFLAMAALAACGDQPGRASPTAPRFNTSPTVVLSGPVAASVNASCTWSATASGGTGPYTFEWDWHLARGDVTGTVGYYSEFNGHVAGDYHFIVTVTDANNLTTADTLQGSTDPNDC